MKVTDVDRTAGKIDLPDWAHHRDHFERTSKFSVPLGQSLDDLEHVLEERLDAIEWRLSTAAPQREGDGRPYARANPDYPGVAVRWSMTIPDEEQPQDFEVVSQRWNALRDNVRELVKYFEEKTRMEDRPIETRRSEFASARKSLPPGRREDATVAKAVQLSMSDDKAADLLDLASPDVPDRMVEVAFQEMAKNGHPDQGGSDDVNRLKQARDQLLDESD